MKKIFTLLTTALVVGLNAQTITLSTNGDDVITGANGVACQGGDNQWAKVFNLSDFGVTGDLTLESGRIGIQSLDMPELVTVSVYAVDASFPNGTFNFLGTQDVLLDVGTDLTYVEYTFDTPVVVPASVSMIAVEVAQPSSGTSFFMGGTAQDSDVSWLWSSQCGVTEYTTVDAIGFPDAHFYITATGSLAGMGTVELGGKALSIYPNPATDVVNVSLADGLQVQSIEVVNMAGQSVYSTKTANSINVSFLPSGTYVVRVKDNKGVTHMNKVVVK